MTLFFCRLHDVIILITEDDVILSIIEDDVILSITEDDVINYIQILYLYTASVYVHSYIVVLHECTFKYKDCECFLVHTNFENDLVEHKCLCSNKFDET